MTPGRDYIGIGVGALIFNDEGLVFLAKRGEGARNEKFTWEFPGGEVQFGETLQAAIKREIREEYGMEIIITKLLGVFDHILERENQHWISITYLAGHTSGLPTILEPDKCEAIGWFPIHQLPAPLSCISTENLSVYLATTDLQELL